jgi:hypothetical protein
MPTWRTALQPRNLLFLLLVAAGFAFLSDPEFFFPWVHYTGGSFHVTPWWNGMGRFTTPDGNYQLYLYLGPLDSSHPTAFTGLEGEGTLCTPSGERLPIHVEGDMDKHLPANTIGRRIEINTYVHSKPGTFSAYTPPGSLMVRLNGTWGIDKIEATGRLDHQPAAPGHPAPPRPAPIAITLRKAGGWWSPACPAR